MSIIGYARLHSTTAVIADRTRRQTVEFYLENGTNIQSERALPQTHADAVAGLA